MCLHAHPEKKLDKWDPAGEMLATKKPPTNFSFRPLNLNQNFNRATSIFGGELFLSVCSYVISLEITGWMS